MEYLPFAGLGGWFKKNRLILFCLSLSGIVVCAVAVRLIPDKNQILARVYMSGIDVNTKNHFRGLLRDCDLRGRNEVWKSDTGENRLNQIRMILPEGHKKEYPDSCMLLLSFTQQFQEPDEATAARLKRMLRGTVQRIAEERSSVNRLFFIELLADSMTYFPAPRGLGEVSATIFPEEKSRVFAGNYLPEFQVPSEHDIRVEFISKEKGSVKLSYLVLFILWNAIVACFFLLRYLIQGK